MDTDFILQSHEQRIKDLESASRQHEGSIAKLADKTESAWHMIRETKQDVGDLYDETNVIKKEVSEMKGDVKGVKAELQNQGKLMKWLAGAVIFFGVAVIVAAIISTTKGSDVPEKTIELMIPAVQKILTTI